ncbi:SDR family oxidoreductase NDAI_0I02450 [Naumovozyma dairenensis CBS 421]|uniref:NAD-dependent epimerase/dehydratase domain-containing protein n=1 Tax=Naumovozyma dairenensis (strain ATCC 10597 / BCRC 20456 / CBS 421 / NBRC 0211 / NRRL Y-12639) TaxID=1071378 RepID=G0WGA2_NAUDC|nr:hypothetical protein NDAI_0I02450 [Naumovozyma dairenensis CBS 421]CCD26813.1 hypothetical protein NDAI_0I02450 [Naumovozyma dairenensis CBS 421]
MSKTVFVSGATGFIATHIVNDLLQAGYKVIGSSRSVEKGEELKKQFNNNPQLSMVVVKDIAQEGAFDEAFAKYGKEISVVLHTASPFTFNVKDYEKDLLIPAVNGTKFILNAIKKYAADNVEHVVITSSMAAVADVKQMATPITLTEESWNNQTWEGCRTDPVTAYCASKLFAERAAWEFLKENKDQVNFTLSTVNPGYVYGPQMFVDASKKVLNTSSEIINQIVHATEESQIMEICGPYIDVRDVSKAHLAAFEKKECYGQRLLLAEGMHASQDILDIINEDFPQLKGKIPVGKPGSGSEILAKNCKVDNRKSKQLLGFPFRSLKQTVDDSVKQILEVEGRL